MSQNSPEINHTHEFLWNPLEINDTHEFLSHYPLESNHTHEFLCHRIHWKAITPFLSADNQKYQKANHIFFLQQEFWLRLDRRHQQTGHRYVTAWVDGDIITYRLNSLPITPH